MSGTPEDTYIDEVMAIAECFRYELCDGCNQDLNQHVIGPDPLGHARVYCMNSRMFHG